MLSSFNYLRLNKLLLYDLLLCLLQKTIEEFRFDLNLIRAVEVNAATRMKAKLSVGKHELEERKRFISSCARLEARHRRASGEASAPAFSPTQVLGRVIKSNIASVESAAECFQASRLNWRYLDR